MSGNIARLCNCYLPIYKDNRGMNELINNICNEKFIFVENLKDLENINGLSKKKLCIAKTDFKDLYLVKRLSKKYPNLEIWLTSSEISRKNILLANANGVKNVIPYPVDTKLVPDRKIRR